MPRSSRKEAADDQRTRPGSETVPAAARREGWISPEVGAELPVAGAAGATPEPKGNAGDEAVVVPLVREDVQLGARAVETGRVRIIKRVREEEQVVQRPLLREAVDVQRVPVERFVEQVPQTRQEGDTLIVPIVEEVLVVEKRLMLKEELRISRQRVSEPYSTQVTVRTEDAHIERVPSPDAADTSRSARRRTRN